MAPTHHATSADVSPIPEGHVLFHVGLPKTGTSSLQHAIAASAARLLDLGVYYPEAPHARLKHHHVEAAGNAMFHLPDEGSTSSKWMSKAKSWSALMKMVDKSSAARAFVSAENASRSTLEQVAALARSLPRPVHVVFTLRNYAELMPSMWQQRVRGGLETTTFEEFVGLVLAANADDPRLHPHVARRFDTSTLVAKWAEAVGADNVTIAFVDKRDPTFIFDAFGALLGLPQGTLERDKNSPLNRSMTFVETELARQAAIATNDLGLSRQDRNSFLLRGGFRRVQERREPSTSEAPIRMSAASVKMASASAHAHAAAISKIGVRTIGDSSVFTDEATALVGKNPPVDTVPVDLAVEAIVGGMLRGLDLNPVTGLPLTPDDE